MSHHAIPDHIRNHKMAWLWKKVYVRLHRKNKMWTAVIVGEPGSGKSWLAMMIALLLDPSFNMERVCFTAKQFAEVMAKDWKKGSFVVLDDAGLSLYSREAMIKSVRQVAKTFMSCRYKNMGIILTLPSLGMLDKSVRIMLNAYFQPLEIDFNKGLTRAKFHYQEYDPKTGKIYSHRPEVVGWESIGDSQLRRIKRLDSLWFEAPPKKFALEYEGVKKDFMDSWNIKNVKEIAGAEAVKERGLNGFQKYFSVVSNDLAKYMNSRKLVDVGLIALKHPDCGLYNAKQIASTLNSIIEKQPTIGVGKVANGINLDLFLPKMAST